ncbi:hypothetical protein GOL94_25110 [Sinorhizobium medicae]|nr:hypothetical protein [Sinorhizobium medicae]
MPKFDVRDTETQLRNYLNNNKYKQEMLAAEMLRVSDHFSNVVTQQTSGARDGGVDIESEFKGRQCISGVGFCNDANDKSDRAGVARKFRADLEAGLKKTPAAKAFAFVTNVNFTTDQRTKLFGECASRGIECTEIFDRDRLVRILNTPRGLLARYTYLDMPLSDDEQKAFFSAWGSDINSTIRESVSGLQDKLDRQAFLADSTFPLRGVTFEFTWREDAPLDPGETLSLAVILHLRRSRTIVNELIAGCDVALSEMEFSLRDGEVTKRLECKENGFTSVRRPGHFKKNVYQDEWRPHGLKDLSIWFDYVDDDHNYTLRSLHEAQISVRGNDLALQRLLKMQVFAAGYEVARYRFVPLVCRDFSDWDVSVDKDENEAIKEAFPYCLHQDGAQFNQLTRTPRRGRGLNPRAKPSPDYNDWDFISWYSPHDGIVARV